MKIPLSYPFLCSSTQAFRLFFLAFFLTSTSSPTPQKTTDLLPLLCNNSQGYRDEYCKSTNFPQPRGWRSNELFPVSLPILSRVCRIVAILQSFGKDFLKKEKNTASRTPYSEMLKLNVFIQPRFVFHHSGVSPTHLSSILVAGDSVWEKIRTKQFHIFPYHFYPFIASLRSCLVWSLFNKTHPGEDSQVLLGEVGKQYKKPQHNNFDPPPPVLILRTEAPGCLPKWDAFS